jgi:hypothetical protein
MTNVLTKQGDKAPNCQGLAWCSNKNAESHVTHWKGDGSCSLPLK